MNWRAKAYLQKAIALLPAKASYALYYYVQEWIGNVTSWRPGKLQDGVEIVKRIRRQGGEVEGKTFLEVGTGRDLNLPLALWLCGASRIITVDKNPYLKAELVLANVDHIRNSRGEIKSLLGDVAELPVFQDRFDRLASSGSEMDKLCEMMQLEYLAPGDAARLELPSGSIDYHVSRVVFEHVPPDVVRGILKEGRRVITQDGLFIHLVDFSDHFSHVDESITPINFLQFSERRWAWYAGNRYAYHNRLRVADFAKIFRESGTKIVSLETSVSERALQALKQGFPLDARFKANDDKVNATKNAWIVAEVA